MSDVQMIKFQVCNAFLQQYQWKFFFFRRKSLRNGYHTLLLCCGSIILFLLHRKSIILPNKNIFDILIFSQIIQFLSLINPPPSPQEVIHFIEWFEVEESLEITSQFQHHCHRKRQLSPHHVAQSLIQTDLEYLQG